MKLLDHLGVRKLHAVDRRLSLPAHGHEAS